MNFLYSRASRDILPSAKKHYHLAAMRADSVTHYYITTSGAWTTTPTTPIQIAQATSGGLYSPMPSTPIATASVPVINTQIIGGVETIVGTTYITPLEAAAISAAATAPAPIVTPVEVGHAVETTIYGDDLTKVVTRDLGIVTEIHTPSGAVTDPLGNIIQTGEGLNKVLVLAALVGGAWLLSGKK